MGWSLKTGRSVWCRRRQATSCDSTRRNGVCCVEATVQDTHSFIGCEYRSSHCVSSARTSVTSRCARRTAKSSPVTNASCVLGWVRSDVLFHTCVVCSRLYSDWLSWTLKHWKYVLAPFFFFWLKTIIFMKLTEHRLNKKRTNIYFSFLPMQHFLFSFSVLK